MDKQAVIRRARIAVSVFFGVVAVALVALWVRSYWRHDVLGVFTGGKAAALYGSSNGVLCLELRDEFGWQDDDPTCFARSMSARRAWPYHGSTPVGAPAGFSIRSYSDSTYVVAPHWFAMVVAAALAGLPWMSFLFSLLTLIFATTLVAVALGLGVWHVR
jgi:hypothetical protein